MNRKLLLLCLIGLISFAACAAPAPDQPSPTVEAPTATVATATATSTATAQPTPTDTVTPTITPTPVVAPDYVWLDSDGLLLYSHSGNLCLKDGDADPVYLMPADACNYEPELYDDGQTIILLSKEGYSSQECILQPGLAYSSGTRIWHIDRQTADVTYLTSNEEVAEQFNLEHAMPVYGFDNAPGLDAYVFTTAFVNVGVSYGKDLFLLDEEGQVTALLEPGDGAMSFEVSPDGQHVAYVSREPDDEPRSTNWIGLINTDGSNHRPRIITYDYIATYSDWSVITRPVWREDSAGFWIAIPPPNRQFEDVPNIMTTWYVPVDGEPVQLGSFEQPLGVIRAATFSPDGGYVAYVATQSGGSIEPGLHIMRPDGSGDYVYFDEERVSWFARWEDNTHFIFRTGTTITEETRVYRGGIGEAPVLIDSYITDDVEPLTVSEGCAP